MQHLFSIPPKEACYFLTQWQNCNIVFLVPNIQRHLPYAHAGAVSGLLSAEINGEPLCWPIKPQTGGGVIW